ncbi:hypothetical protein HWV62_43523 [Athelia sp. TMB]|nr:hypothetical protein HWV62_43523 [Athelia sp. TMB]
MSALGDVENDVVRLADLLTCRSKTVEIVPGDYSTYAPVETNDEVASGLKPFLLAEGNLGVPKKILYRLYLQALQIFADSRASPDAASSGQTPRTRGLAASSAVILLANPAHLTALNARKRLLEAGILQFGAELKYTEVLLSSRNCSNQSILWHHRQWLLNRIRIKQKDDLSMTNMDLWGVDTSLEAELVISARACEMYPRNYFAWAHRYFCINEVISFTTVTKSPSLVEMSAAVISREIASIKHWLETHVSDASAVHHLTSIIERSSAILDITIYADDMQEHAVSLLKSYPEHETMWLYMRAAFRLGGYHPDSQYLVLELVDLWESQVLQPSSHEDDIRLVFAYRFLAVRALQASFMLLFEIEILITLSQEGHLPLDDDSFVRQIITGKASYRPDMGFLK